MLLSPSVLFAFLSSSSVSFSDSSPISPLWSRAYRRFLDEGLASRVIKRFLQGIFAIRRAKRLCKFVNLRKVKIPYIISIHLMQIMFRVFFWFQLIPSGWKLYLSLWTSLVSNECRLPPASKKESKKAMIKCLYSCKVHSMIVICRFGFAGIIISNQQTWL